MTCAIIYLLSMSIICCYHSSLAYLPTPFSPRFYRHHKHQYTKKDDVESITNSVRRDVVGGISFVSQIALLLTTGAASVSYATNTVGGGNKPMLEETMPKDWNKRLRSGNAQMLPRNVLQAPDVYYPSYMAGQWNTTSAGTGFTAPLGEKSFGGASAVRAAERDMNNTLIYPSLFSLLPDDSGRVIADRLFNVKSIAVARYHTCPLVNNPRCLTLTPNPNPNPNHSLVWGRVLSSMRVSRTVILLVGCILESHLRKM